MFLRDLFQRLTSTTPTPDARVELSGDWLIVGLGNPGAKYAATRHNVGYMALDDLLVDGGDVLGPVRGIPAEATVTAVGGHVVALARPTTFMNLSGKAVGPIVDKLGVSPDRVIVLHDELDLPAGKVRIRLGGNENGHNGLKSITGQLGTRDYVRVRIGIGRPPKGTLVSDHVLGPVDGGAEFDTAIATAAEAARLIVAAGVSGAQNRIHAR